MKLTKAQIKALKAVKNGEVILYEPNRMTSPNKIIGARADVITRLVLLKLVKVDHSGSFSEKPIILTDEGRKILEIEDGN